MRTRPLRSSLAVLTPVLMILGVAGLVAGPAGAQVAAPDGRIAFQSDADGDWDIWTMNPDGSDLRNLTSEGETGEGWADSQPSWSPDGSRIAFVSDRSGGSDIFVMGADGADVTRLTVNGDEDSDFGPDWSPDGSRLVFAGERADEGPEFPDDLDIYVIDADGTNEVNVTDGFESQPGQFQWGDKDPDWSPVDDRIVFSSARIVEGADDEGAYWRIVTANPDGSDQTIVSAVDDPGNDPWPDDIPNHDEQPEYSPDGQWIAFGTHQQPEQQWDVQIVRTDGTDQQNVLPAQEWEDLFPTWSETGGEILFTSNRTGDHTLGMYSDDVSSSMRGGTERIVVRAAAATRPFVQEVGGVGRVESPDVFGDRCTIEGTSAGELLVGTSGRDVICARGGDDVIDGLAGDDVLLGAEGDDVLRGGPGRDIAQGGDGIDTVSYRDAHAGVTVRLDEGRATGQGVDQLRRIERVRGSADGDVLVGDEMANSLSGLRGADAVMGLDGDDQLFGGAGQDELDGGMGTDACQDPAPTVYRSCEA